jgi:membrane-associated phospholipid phosphatase
MLVTQSWEIGVIHMCQGLGGWLTTIMQIFTSLGYGAFYLLFVSLVYWCLDRGLGIRMMLFLQLTASVNGILKQAIHAPRPYWVDAHIRVAHASTGFGMPSGHAQMSTVWLLAAAWIRNTWFWIIALMIILMVGISRAYLGLHFPSQILTGWVTGAAMVLGWLILEARVIHWVRTKGLLQQFLIVGTASFVLLLIGGIFVYRLTVWHMPLEWLRNASAHLQDGETINPVGLRGIASYTGGLLGTGWGTILASRFGEHEAGGTWWKYVLRYTLGLVCLVMLIPALEAASPHGGHAILYNSWRFVEHFLILFSVIFAIPLLFLRLGLADKAKKA